METKSFSKDFKLISPTEEKAETKEFIEMKTEPEITEDVNVKNKNEIKVNEANS